MLAELTDERMEKAARALAQLTTLAERLDTDALTEMVRLWETPIGKLARPLTEAAIGLSPVSVDQYNAAATLAVFFAQEIRKLELPR